MARENAVERSQLRLKVEHLQQAVKTVHKFRAMLSSFVWEKDNRKMFLKMDVDCIDLLGYFSKEQHKASEALR